MGSMATVTITVSITTEQPKEQLKGRSMVGSRGTIIHDWFTFVDHYYRCQEMSDPKLIARLFGYRRED